jgi:hypothetical protein
VLSRIRAVNNVVSPNGLQALHRHVVAGQHLPDLRHDLLDRTAVRHRGVEVGVGEA